MGMKMVKVLGICGSLRKGSFNHLALEAAGRLMPPHMRLDGITLMEDLPMYNPDVEAAGFPATARALSDRIREADALLFSSPEYNWTMSASLKNGIDWVSRFKTPAVPFHDKPCAILSATTGPLGGSRVQYDVRRAVTSLGGLFLVKPEIFIGMAAQKFDPSGALVDARTVALIRDQMQQFGTWIERMQPSVA